MRLPLELNSIVDELNGAFSLNETFYKYNKGDCSLIAIIPNNNIKDGANFLGKPIKKLKIIDFKQKLIYGGIIQSGWTFLKIGNPKNLELAKIEIINFYNKFWTDLYERKITSL